jgi:hypothetical protein
MSVPESCPHERRPGVTICLQCRNAEHRAARGRLARAVLTGALAVGVAGGIAGAVLLRPGATRPEGGAVARPAATEASSAATLASGRAGDAAAKTAGISAPSVALAAPATGTVKPPVAPRIAEGRTELRDGVYALRAGDTIAVHFDTPLARTRRPEKFERLVRATLPRLYGEDAERALAALPSGALVAQGDLLAELPVRGVRIPVGDGWELALHPATRPGQDGPLVVSYAVTLAR